MPAEQRDGLVVGVPHPSPHVDPGIASHCLPAPALRSGVGGHDAAVFRFEHPVGVSGADIDGLPAGSVAVLDPVWLSAVTPSNRLVSEHQTLVHNEARYGQEEPFPLPSIGGILATVACLGPERLTPLSVLNLFGLQRLLCLTNRPNRRDSGMAATNQCRSSCPQRNFRFSTPSRTSSKRCRSSG